MPNSKVCGLKSALSSVRLSVCRLIRTRLGPRARNASSPVVRITAASAAAAGPATGGRPRVAMIPVVAVAAVACVPGLRRRRWNSPSDAHKEARAVATSTSQYVFPSRFPRSENPMPGSEDAGSMSSGSMPTLAPLEQHFVEMRIDRVQVSRPRVQRRRKGFRCASCLIAQARHRARNLDKHRSHRQPVGQSRDSSSAACTPACGSMTGSSVA